MDGEEMQEVGGRLKRECATRRQCQGIDAQSGGDSEKPQPPTPRNFRD
jgi:hypothetical protein